MLVPRFDHHVSLILAVTIAPLRIREIYQCQCTPGRVLYEWLMHLVFLSVAPSDAPSFVVARVLEEVDLALGYSCSYCPDSRSV